MNLDDAVAAARRNYARQRPTSRDWGDRARTVQPGGNTRSVLDFAPFPFRVARADGRELVDVDGHRYIDLLGNYTAGLLGHNPGPVLDAIHAALANGWSLGSVHVNEVRFAELLVQRFEAMEQVRFTNSGTEANLMALAAATHHTGRSKIVVFANGYHGGVLSFAQESSPVNVPHDWQICRYNDLRDVESAFEDCGRDIAAVLVEPMQGSGGCIAGTPTFLAGLRQLCDSYGSMLVFDEVMTSRFPGGGAQGLLGIDPDLTTLGKYLAGGMTFGAFGGRTEVMSHFDPAAGGRLGHAGTFNNNTMSMAAGVATLTDVLTEEVLSATHDRGEQLRASLNNVFAQSGLGMCATGVGSLLGVHGTAGPVTSADDLADSDHRLAELFFFHCLDAGFYLARRGFIALSIEVTDADLEAFVEVVEGFDPTA
ncbi:MAG: aspartate aminotransferase family protein [Actinomycetia bacterium]|nr:aspartate aminotransferase family protein [Actinomycetes bacterium]MCP4957761.1 aspartate aminotransferase family protein [Actinomycetes bacterium]